VLYLHSRRREEAVKPWPLLRGQVPVQQMGRGGGDVDTVGSGARLSLCAWNADDSRPV
jgi:hypothetical protein